MFVKWFKELTREWWNQWSGLLEVIFTGWLVTCFVFCIADVLSFGGNGSWVSIHKYLIPVMWATGIVPFTLRMAWKFGNYIFALYLDYTYFAANGGKRKRKDGP